MTVDTDTMQEGYAGPVRAHQRTAEFDQLVELFKDRQPLRVLEIGTYEGGTLYHWLQNAPDGAVVVSVDDYRMGVDNRALYPSWTPGWVTIRVFCGDSHDPSIVEAVAENGPYDFVFIDADHSYGAVKADWAMCREMCAPGAVVAFHDILPPSAAHPEIEVSVLWEEIKAGGYETCEFVADRSAPWGGIGVVFLPEETSA